MSTHRLIWVLGYLYVEKKKPDRRIKARATGEVALVTSQDLLLEVNGEPYPRHADIIGWPTSGKPAQMMLATQIANEMILELDPRG